HHFAGCGGVFSDMNAHWTWYRWNELTPDTLHALLKLRSDVFVVEQDCVYADIDGRDPQCEHLCASDGQGVLLACLRLVPPGVKYELPAIGRLVVAPPARKLGLARAGMRLAIERCAQRWPRSPVFLQAQQYLQPFYASLGFAASGEPYVEDGIPHIDMVMHTH
ncbi:MAG TPA: GNAT family N-acetyltransferase, partial [Nevskiaceae bacterium]|nr:GNAT family N-acetyltransferase [Nevskiaceae bacterium]